MRRLALAPITAILLALVPGSVLALVPGDLDQSNVLDPMSLGSSTDQAQTFTAGKTGFLDDVELMFSGSGTITMTIQATTAGLPNGTVLATTTATLVSVDGFVDFVFASPASVTSGTMYAFIFNTGVAAAAWGTDIEDADAYAPGQALAGPAPWATNTFIGDFAFRTYVRAATAPTPSGNGTPPPTSTGAPGSTDPPASVALICAAVIALYGGLLAVVATRRRGAFRI
jgi:hypothetical protein